MSQLPEVHIEVAFSTGAVMGTALHLDDASRGLLDMGTLAGSDLWEDVSAYGRGVSTSRGSSRIEGPVIRYEAGRATIRLDNADRRFDPTNMSGPYVAAGRTQVTPMREVRIRATWAGVTYPVWRGFADSWDLEWDGPEWAETTVPCTDGFKVLGNRRRAAVAPVGAGEDSGARVNRILDSANWPELDRMVAAGDSTLQATTLEGDPLAELQLVADSEAGELYVDGSGHVTFRGRLALLQDERSNTPQGVFGDQDGELRYADKGLSISTDDATLYNEVRLTRVGGTEQVEQDLISQAEFQIRTFDRSDLLLETDAEVADYAAWILHVSHEPEVRFDSIRIKPLRDPDALFPQVLAREIGDRITIIRRPPGGGDPIERDCFIRGIAHEIGLDNWETTWSLQSAERMSFLTLDHPVLGVLDSNALAY
ncbi:hypothetical protein HNP84_000233 [Thermocatellispora tengchongensis]|uniref:Uncharacterized protein n=1 Tax=Thermocatellispora tengchongensis TaxID=1073253 RepID=A0A840P3C1_9ACTN|nr:hypothetical protein [Thermocatellispora tengchongensis]MBB5130545.1 hypothetical protein [Thermocatellispora tengchongensis]